MFIAELAPPSETVRLIRPDVIRDAQLAVGWLSGEAGRDTLRRMGVIETNNRPTTLAQEQHRIHDFLQKPDQLNWMIAANGKVAGSIWVDLQDSEYLAAPSIHIMLGDVAARGHGMGTLAFQAVTDWLSEQRPKPVLHTRHLADNEAAARVAQKAGFHDDGSAYRDSDRLLWQNMRLSND